MKKVYYNPGQLDKVVSREHAFLRVSERADGIYDDPTVQAQFLHWLVDSGEEKSFAALLSNLVVDPISEFLHYVPDHADDQLYQQAAVIFENAQTELFATLLQEGVDDKKANQENFNKHVTALYERLKYLTSEQAIIWHDSAVDFIQKVNELGKARDEGVFDELDEDMELGAYYPAATRKSFSRIISRSEELLARVMPSQKFSEIFRHYEEMAAPVVNGNYNLLPKDQFAKKYSFAPSPRPVTDYIGDITPAPATLTTKGLHIHATELLEPEVKTLAALLNKHPVVKYQTGLGTVRYVLRDPKLITPLAHERE